jgi:hypothetical protein
MSKQVVINNHFQHDNITVSDRQRFTQSLKYSNFNIISKFDVTSSVLDVGCGENLFKQYLPNLTGIDPVFDAADIKTTLQEYQPEHMFDVAICFGSMHFGTRQDVEQSIDKLCSLLKPNAKIFWRCWCDTTARAKGEVPFFYKWTIDDHKEFSKQFGFNLDFVDYDYNDPRNFSSYRIYAEWSR